VPKSKVDHEGESIGTLLCNSSNFETGETCCQIRLHWWVNVMELMLTPRIPTQILHSADFCSRIFLTVDSVCFGFREADKRNGYVSGGYLSDQFLAMLENYFKENELESDTLI